MQPWFLLILAVVSEVVGTSALKASDGFTKIAPSLLVVASFGAAFYFLAIVLKSIPVGVAYAIWSGLGIVFISLIGFFVFKQKLDFPALLGIALILAGVVIMNVFSKNVVH